MVFVASNYVDLNSNVSHEIAAMRLFGLNIKQTYSHQMSTNSTKLLHWQFSPRGGRAVFLSEGGRAVFSVKGEGSFPLRGREGSFLRGVRWVQFLQGQMERIFLCGGRTGHV